MRPHCDHPSVGGMKRLPSFQVLPEVCQAANMCETVKTILQEKEQYRARRDNWLVYVYLSFYKATNATTGATLIKISTFKYLPRGLTSKYYQPMNLHTELSLIMNLFLGSTSETQPLPEQLPAPQPSPHMAIRSWLYLPTLYTAKSSPISPLCCKNPYTLTLESSAMSE